MTAKTKKRGTASPQSDSPMNNDSLEDHNCGNDVKNCLSISSTKFEEMYNLPIGHLVEKRGHGGNFSASYLSWAHASRLLYTNFEGIHPDLELNEEGSILHDFGNEYNQDFHLRIFLTNGVQRTPSIFFPVMDKMFKSMDNPTSREVSDAVQRGKVKAIAEFTGIGLKLYSGEDIPSQNELDTAEVVAQADRVEPIKEDTPQETAPAPKREFKNIAPPENAVFLKCSFKDKEKVKQLGAKFDGESKKWWFDPSQDYEPFKEWMSDSQIAKFTEDVVNEYENKPIDDIAEQGAGDPTDPDLDEDVPF